MNKKVFKILVILMSLALVGIIFVQGFWIQTTFDNKARQFSLNINQALRAVSEQIQQRELRDYIAVYQKLRDSIQAPKASEITALFQYVDRNESTNKTYVYAHGLLEEDYNISLSLFDPKFIDTTSIKDYKQIQSTTIIDESFEEEMKSMSSIERLQRIDRLSLMDQAKYAAIFQNVAANRPIHKRLTTIELDLLLRNEFAIRDLNLPFEYRVFEGVYPTKIGSENFNLSSDNNFFETPLFVTENGNSTYDLRVSFPDQDRFLRRSIMGTAVMSILFIFIIIVTFSSAIYQLLRQKKISEVKSDFINNMTHEFKTPIATINLALDAFNNTTVQNDANKRLQYLNMIREENKRMHIQVENVLRISQLERREIELQQEPVGVHALLHDAIDHLRLIFESQNSVLSTSFEASQDGVLGSGPHLTNVWINILENAIKYSDKTPVIDVLTQSDESFIWVTITDKGIGMPPSVKKRIFNKFYRQTSGNIHNVKGHGLGLSYVKQIVDMHHGTIAVESEIKKGSKFVIKLPLNPEK